MTRKLLFLLVTAALASMVVSAFGGQTASAKPVCQGSRVVGEISGNVRVCFIGTDSFNGDQYEITVTQVDGPGSAIVSVCTNNDVPHGSCGFRNPAVSMFSVGACTTDVISFAEGFAPGSVVNRIAFVEPPNGFDVLGEGRVVGLGAARPGPC